MRVRKRPRKTNRKSIEDLIIIQNKLINVLIDRFDELLDKIDNIIEEEEYGPGLD